MSGSKQGHKRFTISRKLKELVGRDILLFSLKPIPSKIESGKLEFQTQENSNNAGFYFNEKQIPVRSIKKINYYSPPEVIVDIGYLIRPHGFPLFSGGKTDPIDLLRKLDNIADKFAEGYQ